MKKLKSGDKVFDQMGRGGGALVLKRIGRGVTGQQYVRVRWWEGNETSEPVDRFGGK